ncbi:hypothetical protein JCM10212_004179 [Sporobolomyces blumeae]
MLASTNEPVGAEKADSDVDGLSSAHDIDFDFAANDASLDRRILLKTDGIVLVLLVLVAVLEFLDKNALAYAAVWGLRQDTGLKGQEYSQVASVFYYGYLGALFVNMWLVTKVPAAKLVGVSTSLWAVVLLSMAACRNYAGLLCVRFFLGVCEAAILPCFMIMTSLWYKKKEQPLRTALWYNTFAGIFGGILSYAIGHINGSLAKWKYLFLIYGSVTLVVGIVVVLVLPSRPDSAWFFSPRERIRAVARLSENQQSVQVKEFRIHHCIEAVKSPRYWILILFAIAQSITNAGVTNFNPLIIGGFGFSPSRTTLMATPQAAVALVAQVSFSIVAYYVPNIRCLLWMISCVPAIVGCVLIHVLDHVTQRGACLAGVYLLGFYNVSWVLALSLATSNTAGTTKKAFTSTSISVAYAVGNIIGPQAFRAKEAPTYESGIVAMLVCFSAMFVLGGAYWIAAVVSNRRREKQFGVVEPEEMAPATGDVTDGENDAFRYSY